jgi:glutaconate CoA-transferase subunit A
MKDKLTPLDEAISRNVDPGSGVVLGACLEPDIPFAATYEIIRQGIRKLNVIAPISDASTDMLIGAGCVAGITGAWVGNVSGGLGHNYRRAFENGEPGPITVHDHSNLSLGMALMAGAYGIPYLPMRSILGSDILRSNPDFRLGENPFSQDKEPVVLVPPLKPDVAILAIQRADRYGNAHHWGSGGLTQESALAAEKVVLIADEIVEPDVIASDPSRVLIPGYLVTAVCHVPGAAHPSPMTGRWRRDNDFFADYHRVSRTREGFLAWLRDWVLDVPDHAAYRTKLGKRLDDLRIKDTAPAAMTSYAAA